MDDAQLSSLLDQSETVLGWGRHQTVDIGGSKVFVKRVPVTEIEYRNPLSTSNLYDLPMYYHYGVGSAGFGVFRELATHIKTTNWVLAGSIANFPLLYHHRIMPFGGARANFDADRHEAYVRYWNGNASIGNYLRDRVNAKHELVLFLEHVPHVLHTRLLEHPGELPRALDELRATITFLRAHGIIHFDAHFFNVVTDGERVYLTDFGMALDRRFALADDEARLFRRHTHYDYGEVLWGVGYLASWMYNALPEQERSGAFEKYGIRAGTPARELAARLLGNIEEIVADGAMALHEALVDGIVKYRPVILLMDGFLSSMRGSGKKDGVFPHAELRRLLAETGFV